MTQERAPSPFAGRLTRRDALGQGLALGIAGRATPGDRAAGSPDEVITGELGFELDENLSRFATYGFCGAALVAVGDQVSLYKGYGAADVDRSIPNRADTRFEMNSMTKMFTGVAILKLAASGRLDLDAPVERYLGPFPVSKRSATVRQLADHTAGLIVRGTDLPGDTRAAFVDAVRQSPQESAPGEAYRYTNAGYSLLAAIIEIVSGESYEDFLRGHLFAPAGMTTAIFRDSVPMDHPRFAHGYVGTPAALAPGPPNPYVWGTRGAGGVWCTLVDFRRWIASVRNDAILPAAQRAVLFAPPRPPSEEAFGWHVGAAADGRQLISKGGGSDDFASQLLYYPRDGVAIIWACNNLRQRWRRTLNRTMTDIAFGGAGANLPAVAPLPQTALAACSGRFATDMGGLVLDYGDGFLFARENDVAVPTNLMFFPQGARHFTGFDPVAGVRTTLEFDAGLISLTITLPDASRIELRRQSPVPE